MAIEAVSVITSVELSDQPRVQEVLLLTGEHVVTCVTRVTSLSRASSYVLSCCVTLDHVHWLTAALTLAWSQDPHDRRRPGCEGYAPRNTGLPSLPRHSELRWRCSLLWTGSKRSPGCGMGRGVSSAKLYLMDERSRETGKFYFLEH